MVEVLLPQPLQRVVTVLESYTLSKPPLLSLRKLRKQVLKDFKERDLSFHLKYEPITPYANKDIEAEYIEEVQFVGREERFNLEDFSLFSSNPVEEEKEKDLFAGLEEFDFGDLESLLGVDDSVPKETPQAPANSSLETLQTSKVEKVDTSHLTFREGMTLRDFLRENPRSTMSETENFFSKEVIMKEIRLGKVVRRGQKLFI